MLKSGTSILIPSWKNWEYLNVCIRSLEKNSSYEHEIIVCLNESTEQEFERAKAVYPNVKFVWSPENLGVCRAMNLMFKEATKDIIGYFNDDMVALPEWDNFLQSFVDTYKIDLENATIASTMIEPLGNNICCVAPFNFGTNLQEFNYDALINLLPVLRKAKKHFIGNTWTPNFIHRKLWEKVGGYSEEYITNFGSDPDLIKKLYDIGVRDFFGVGDSLVYHFGSKTTKRVKFENEPSEDIFYQKFGMSIAYFVEVVLNRGKIYERA